MKYFLLSLFTAKHAVLCLPVPDSKQLEMLCISEFSLTQMHFQFAVCAQPFSIDG